jgi:hypothetical protein
MSIELWLNRRAAEARLRELEHELQRLQEERGLLSSALTFLRGGRLPGNAAANGGEIEPYGDGGAARDGRRGRGPRSSLRHAESMTKILVDTMARGPAGKSWTIAELVDAMGKSHPGRVMASNASSLVSAALAQALRAKQPAFVSRKKRGRRNNLYRLA